MPPGRCRSSSSLRCRAAGERDVVGVGLVHVEGWAGDWPSGVELPALSVKTGLSTIRPVPSPLVLAVCGLGVEAPRPEVASVAVKATWTSVVYHPLLPAVPAVTES